MQYHKKAILWVVVAYIFAAIGLISDYYNTTPSIFSIGDILLLGGFVCATIALGCCIMFFFRS